MQTADTRIYRPFFLAGIATVLSLGCLWGAINLLTIGMNRSFGVISYSWTLAHGHAMVFGFVGSFIMGFAYHAVPRFKETNLWQPRLALSSLPLMLMGIAIQAVAHLSVPSPWSMPLEWVAAGLQFIAVCIFALVIIKTARAANKPEIQDRFVHASLAWLVIAAIANPIIFKLFEFPGSRANLLFNLATFNIPYRDVQLIGVAVLMILGVGLRILPGAYGLRTPSRLWQGFMFWGINGALLGGAVLFIAGMTTNNHWLLLLQWVTAVVLLVVAIGTPFQYRLFSSEKSDRGLKFIRAAYVWLIIATLMLVFVPIYCFGIYMPLTGSTIPFSHAFFGAYRHAITVGFVMMMIIGMSSRLIGDRERAYSLWPTFILINLGNILRVSFQIGTDFSPAAYTVMGFSGFIEVVGLVLWAHELVRCMRQERTNAPEPIPLVASLNQ